MKKLNRKDIQIIAQYSTWSEKGIQKALQNNVYNSAYSWYKFLKILFLSLGIGFTTVGVIFFFAYNWNGLHKFIKIWIFSVNKSYNSVSRFS